MSDDKQSRTEDATETKKRDAVERGNVPVSREVATAAACFAILAIATLLLPRAAGGTAAFLAGLLDRAGTTRVGTATAANGLAASVGLACAAFLLPMLTLLAAAGILASVVQTPLRFVGQRLQPDLSRLSPGAGLKRLLGARGGIEFLKSVAKVLGLGAIAVAVLVSDTPRMLATMRGDPASLPQEALAVAAHLLAAVALAMSFVAVLDVLGTRRHWRADLRMTRHEVKEEHKQAEGDPLVKARLRSIALDRARRRMMADVPRATMIVTNPTHFAVALRYVRGEGGAPVVVAKGRDLLALRIREIARDHGIPLVENKPLARALYDGVAVDGMIPSEFYRAVAEIINTLDRRGSVFAS